jgi:hypothetical protein
MLIYVVTVSYNSPGPSLTPPIPVSVLWPAIAPLQLLVSVEPPEPNRKSGIRNRNNPRCFSSFHFSNRKFFALFHPAPRTSSRFQPPASSPPDSNRDTAIRNPNKRRSVNHFQFSNRDKTRCLRPPWRTAVFASALAEALLASRTIRGSRAFSDHFAPNVRLRTGGSL